MSNFQNRSRNKIKSFFAWTQLQFIKIYNSSKFSLIKYHNIELYTAKVITNK